MTLRELWTCLTVRRLPDHRTALLLLQVARYAGRHAVATSCPLCGGWHVRVTERRRGRTV